MVVVIFPFFFRVKSSEGEIEAEIDASMGIVSHRA